MIKRAIAYCLLFTLYISLISCTSRQLRAGRQTYTDAVDLIIYQKGYITQSEKVKDLFASAKEQLIDALHTGNLDADEKITAISIIARAYLEEENFDKTEEYIVNGMEIIDTAKKYVGDETLIGIIKGDALMKQGKDAIFNIKEKDSGLKNISKERAIGYFSEALYNYFLGTSKSGNTLIERLLDLRKIAGFVEKAKVWKTHTSGGKEDANINVVINLKSAMEIAQRNVNKKLIFDDEFKRYKKLLDAELEEFEDY